LLLIQLSAHALRRRSDELPPSIVTSAMGQAGATDKDLTVLVERKCLVPSTQRARNLRLCAVQGIELEDARVRILAEKNSPVRASQAREQSAFISCEACARAWNIMAARTGLSSVRQVGDMRVARVAEYLVAHGETFAEQFCAACEAIGQWTPFLIGRNDASWRATFDWLMAHRQAKASPNWVRVLEGEFGVKPDQGPTPARQQEDAQRVTGAANHQDTVSALLEKFVRGENVDREIDSIISESELVSG